MATLKDVFGGLIDDSFITVSEGEVLALDISRENAEVFVTAKFGQLLNRSVIADFEKHITKVMELRCFRLFPKYTPDMLCAEYFPQLVERLKTTAKVVNGYFGPGGGVLFRKESVRSPEKRRCRDPSKSAGGFRACQADCGRIQHQCHRCV